MSKRAFKKYIKGLKKKDLEVQLEDLYERFDEVRVYYNFVFNPNEDKLVREAKMKISKEYFPPNKRKPKTRRSIAQKFIKHFLKLEMDPFALADVMLYNIEIAQTFAASKEYMPESFEKSMLNSFEQAVTYIIENNMDNEFGQRIHKIETEAENLHWGNTYAFNKLADQFT
ncbi:DUF6155 family protein [Gramella sp. AN32]|uniref:DUF6155 family protein n=1 Tax=Christiangramia antarctica TaxID=2058158 RepID=A0ABW5X7S7_9FLAO|nr:DUF6155 family protein [Gramella sp. AN32]MCM4157362.1 hypothetical protein [Gramella sp. AN32]